MTVGERRKTQLVIVIILSIDDDTVDVDTCVEYGQLTASRQPPQTYAAVRRSGRHELVAWRYTRTQNLQNKHGGPKTASLCRVYFEHILGIFLSILCFIRSLEFKVGNYATFNNCMNTIRTSKVTIVKLLWLFHA